MQIRDKKRMPGRSHRTVGWGKTAIAISIVLLIFILEYPWTMHAGHFDSLSFSKIKPDKDWNDILQNMNSSYFLVVR